MRTTTSLPKSELARNENMAKMGDAKALSLYRGDGRSEERSYFLIHKLLSIHIFLLLKQDRVNIKEVVVFTRTYIDKH